MVGETMKMVMDDKAIEAIVSMLMDLQDRDNVNVPLYEQQLREAGVEEQGRILIERAIEQPLDPQRLAHGIRNEEEALEIYFLSCAAIDIDHFMERSYLNALGDALKIPQDVREGIEQDLKEQKQALPG